MVDSIRTVIQPRDAHSDDLALAPAQRPAPVHQLPIELEMLAHDGRMHRVDLDDVVRIVDAICCGEFGGRNVSNERHGRVMVE